jgi:hypothetical protein
MATEGTGLAQDGVNNDVLIIAAPSVISVAIVRRDCIHPLVLNIDRVISQQARADKHQC